MTLHDQEFVRNNGQTRYLRLKTSVTLHIEQKVRSRNIKAWNEMIDRGVVTRSRQGSKAKIERKEGGIAGSGEQLDNVPKETLVFSIMRKSFWKREHASQTKGAIVLSCIKFEGNKRRN